MNRASYLVLDEADRMFDMGFGMVVVVVVVVVVTSCCDIVVVY